MKKTMVWMIVFAMCLLCGCERSIETDPVLFCRSFNERSETLRLLEENTFLCSETEYLLYAGDVLLRLETDDAQCIHSVIVSADGKQAETLRDAAQTAFSVLSEPFTETPPASFLKEIETGESAVLQTQTEHFTYLLYRSPDTVTVLQVNRLFSALPSLPELHSSGTPTSSAENASQSR